MATIRKNPSTLMKERLEKAASVLETIASGKYQDWECYALARKTLREIVPSKRNDVEEDTKKSKSFQTFMKC